MTLDIEDICIDLSKNNKKIDDEIELFKKNYNKIYMGEYFDESCEDSKIDAEFMIVFTKNKKNIVNMYIK